MDGIILANEQYALVQAMMGSREVSGFRLYVHITVPTVAAPNWRLGPNHTAGYRVPTLLIRNRSRSPRDSNYEIVEELAPYSIETALTFRMLYIII